MRKRKPARRTRTGQISRHDALPQNGLDDLPVEVAVAIEENAQTPKPSEQVQNHETVEDLVSRLRAIRERIWRLHAMFAVSLSHDCALEANQYLHRFQDLARQLREKDASALEDLVRGHESLLLSPSVLVKETIPLNVQRWCEVRWEVSKAPARQVPSRFADNVPDGLGWML